MARPHVGAGLPANGVGGGVGCCTRRHSRPGAAPTRGALLAVNQPTQALHQPPAATSLPGKTAQGPQSSAVGSVQRSQLSQT